MCLHRLLLCTSQWQPLCFFKPSQGLRQDDRLLPFLFILIMDALSRLVSRAKVDGALHGIKLARRVPPISHLLFADDLMFFCRANPREAHSLQHILSTFELWTGQTTNMSKSFVSFGKNMRPAKSSRICQILRVGQAPDPGVYLGLPYVLSRSKRATFAKIKENVQKRVAGWKAKALFQAGRTVLINSVASALPAYVMSVFLFLKGLCQSIDVILKIFWRGFSDSSMRRFHPKAWSSICQPKESGAWAFAAPLMLIEPLLLNWVGKFYPSWNLYGFVPSLLRIYGISDFLLLPLLLIAPGFGKRFYSLVLFYLKGLAGL